MDITASFNKVVKRIAVFSLVATLFFLGHYYAYTTPIEHYNLLRIINTSALVGICLFGSACLLTDPQRTRAHTVFAVQMLLVAAASVITLVVLVWYGQVTVSSDSDPMASLWVMIFGNIYAFILLLYPFELLNPHRKGFGRYLTVFLPIAVASLIYYCYNRYFGGQVAELETVHDLMNHLTRFDVWFRIAIFIYPMWMFVLIMRQKKRYINWCRHNFSNLSYIDLGWLNYYLFGYCLILISYMVFVLLRNPQSMLLHSFAFLAFFAFALFNILRQEEPVSSEVADISEAEMTESTPPGRAKQDSAATNNAEDDKYRFVDRIPQYKAELEIWMMEQCPYRDKDFKLLDVMQVLPLNRSYLSRLFNEGYGEPFFNFVMRYRINESIRLLENNSELTIGRISERCGFSSPSVFGRAFLKVKGVTPNQYRSRFVPS